MIGTVHFYTAQQSSVTVDMPFRWNVTLTASPQASITQERALESLQLAANPPATRLDATSPPTPSVRTAPTSVRPSLVPDAAAPAPFASAEKASTAPSRETASESGISNVVPIVSDDQAVAWFETLPPWIPQSVEQPIVQVVGAMQSEVVRHAPVPVERSVRQRDVHPDYDWLMRHLREKVEQVKWYPPVARANRWQGRVVVQVRVDGRGELLAPAVEESSGYAVLDDAAVKALAAASPLTLAYDLSDQDVVMLVPMNYQLE
ncbi:MAG: TonB family protein [Nitrospiraceae bacterium]